MWVVDAHVSGRHVEDPFTEIGVLWGLLMFYVLLILLHSCLVQGWIRMAMGNVELRHWPEDRACPLLWSDPASNWIWQLA